MKTLNRLRYMLNFAIGCAALSACALNAPAGGDVSAQVADLRNELKALRAEVNQLRQALNARPNDPVEAKGASTVRFDTGATPGSLKAKVALIACLDYQCISCEIAA